MRRRRGQGQGENKHSPRLLAAAERALQALELRKGGASYDQIAERLDYCNRGGAYKAVEAALRRTVQEPADEVRRLEIERLDALWLQAYLQARNGHLGALDRCLRLMERRAKLLGLDAPAKVAPVMPDGQPLVLKVEYINGPVTADR